MSFSYISEEEFERDHLYDAEGACENSQAKVSNLDEALENR